MKDERKVLLIEKNEVYLATVTDPKKGYSRENLKDIVLCPKELKLCVPSVVLQRCRVHRQPQFLYRKGEDWILESVQ